MTYNYTQYLTITETRG